MPGSTFKKCSSCNVHISVACKMCKHCGQKQEMKKAIKVAKQKINERWVKNMKDANNFCKLINSTNILMHKMHALGRYPILLLGKRNVSGSFSTDVITDTSFSSPEEKLSIETIKNIFSTLLKVKYSGRDNQFERNQSMSPSEEDNVVSNDVDATGDDPSPSTDGEDAVTLTLTPVDLSHESSHFCQPPIKKKIVDKNSSAVLQASTSAASVHHVPVSKSIKENSSAVLQASTSAASVHHVPVSKSIKENSSAVLQASTSAASVHHVPVSKSIKENSSAVLQVPTSAASVHHLPVSKSNKFRYKIKECPVHLQKEQFPFVKTMGTRIAKNGKKETKVRWQPCSGCGVKWKDTWEPYDRFPSD